MTPGNSGIPRFEQAKLDQMTTERAAAGFQIGFHAIGDRAASMALDAFARQAREAAHRHPAATLSVFASSTRRSSTRPTSPDSRRLGVIASMQPNHLLTDMNWAEQRLGPERAQVFLRMEGLSGCRACRLAFGTDYPVEPVTPFRGIYCAVTRKNEAGTQTYPGEPLSIREALLAYTQGSAYAQFAEDGRASSPWATWQISSCWTGI